LALFGTPPPNCTSTHTTKDDQDTATDASDIEERPACSGHTQIGASQPDLTKHGDVYYLQSPELVHALLDVERYAKRWPLIPPEELHASSVQHPNNVQWRWLLHSRRVPVKSSGASLPGTDTRPPCAGIGDEFGIVFCCWDCLVDIAARKPKMPLNACANDNWIGRERRHVREASQATKMLASLGRCCWKQLRLGRRGDPAAQDKS
jgi:hypothetical protein